MTVTIDIDSFIIGLVIGSVISFIIIIYAIFRDNGAWSMGFYDGWKHGKKYAERMEAERKEE